MNSHEDRIRHRYEHSLCIELVACRVEEWEYIEPYGSDNAMRRMHQGNQAAADREFLLERIEQVKQLPQYSGRDAAEESGDDPDIMWFNADDVFAVLAGYKDFQDQVTSEAEQ